MMDIIMKIMVEVLSILSIATKEIKEKRMSELTTNAISRLAHPHIERFFKKLAGGSDVEDALKRLDGLTREEARMAIAQILKATHNVDDRLKAIFEGTETVVILSSMFS
jgi:predicted transcriptional regulator